MALDPRSKLILWIRAGGHCSFPECGKALLQSKSDLDREVFIGEIAHIVSEKARGPRGDQKPPGGDFDSYENTILLCEEHHKIIDGQEQTYTVVRLVQFKKDHEDWVRTQLSKKQRYLSVTTPQETINETIFSSLLPVITIPHRIYLAPCEYSEEEVRELICDTSEKSLMLPYIVRGGNLLSFNELNDQSGPFRMVIDPFSAKAHNALAWWEDPDYYRWYIELLNRSLNKLTGRKGLMLDKEHRRYYFEPQDNGIPKSITYASISGKKSTRQVAWRPRFKYNDEYKPFWEHLAISLRFHLISEKEWCLSIRPERRFTKDGFTPLESERIGKRSTKRKAHMYNFDVLKEIHFWQDYLSGGMARIICKFGKQSLIIDSNLLKGEVNWPAIPEDMKHNLKVFYEDDLLSIADFNEATQFENNDS